MRRLILSLGLCLVPFTSACDIEDVIDDAYKEEMIQVHGSVKTSQGVPVEGVSVRFDAHYSTIYAQTDSNGRYETPESSLRAYACSSLELRFRKGEYWRDVLVGKCGRQEVNISDWPGGG